MKEYDAQISPRTHPVVALGFVRSLRPAAAARSGTAEEQKACNRDVQKFCRPVIDQGDFTILACLKENRAEDQRRLRPGSEEQRPIRRRPAPDNAGGTAIFGSMTRVTGGA